MVSCTYAICIFPFLTSSATRTFRLLLNSDKEQHLFFLNVFDSLETLGITVLEFFGGFCYNFLYSDMSSVKVWSPFNVEILAIFADFLTYVNHPI